MVRSDIHTALALIVPAHPARSPAAVLPRRHREAARGLRPGRQASRQPERCFLSRRIRAGRGYTAETGSKTPETSQNPHHHP